ncbi:MAG: GTP cyclohydrolase I FolE2 [Armatimonadetes bacterium]|nr:GTP cyclohydrolase I FolE2 [Armatimonadota bacterium]
MAATRDLHHALADMQSTADHRGIDIQKVGIRHLRYPIVLSTRDNGGTQHTIADINMYVSLSRSFKGTHMSRFVEVLNQHRKELDIHDLGSLLEHMKESLDAEDAYVELRFPYFLNKEAPVTGQPGLLHYDCVVSAAIDPHDSVRITYGATVPVTTLCPCSREISEYGAHNQRSLVTVQWQCNVSIWLEEIIELVEGLGSAQIYSVLKRPDEKFVTEHAYDHPKFVEDVVRDVTGRLREDERVLWFRVESENFESIHTHNAYALIEECKLSGSGGLEGPLIFG